MLRLLPWAVMACLVACSSTGAPAAPSEPSETVGRRIDVRGLKKRGEDCTTTACRPSLECVRYYGMAGPAGPQLASCETRCDQGQTCPDGHQCVMLRDGPGQVCRALES